MIRRTWQWLMIGLGWLALVGGLIGIFVPLLPTTPLVLLAAFFFSKGSKRLHRWLLQHRRFGRYVRDWERERVIPPVGKYASTLFMVPSVGFVVLTRDLPIVLSGGMLLTVVAVLWFIWSRPSRTQGGGQRSEAPAKAAASPSSPPP